MLKAQANLALPFDAAVGQNSWQSQTNWSETHEASCDNKAENTATKEQSLHRPNFTKLPYRTMTALGQSLL
ncbi:MAG: hypothetical protein D0433_06500 [Candidatus Thermochlorobacter aerophilum]|jgi:hypothetical protein|uniref:Uncharacterized protein n=1 Tax=Candidatus Thermochlorobacter aerophilus TaxID=1868324 RepID=A0A395M0M9_9BACT|nr:MAG: hypothetical protein D0433_06500 [Candidatus Thermochlorobacter aerophilum]